MSSTEASSVEVLVHRNRDTAVSCASRPEIVVPHLLDQDIGDTPFREHPIGEQIEEDLEYQIEEDLEDWAEEDDQVDLDD